MESIWATIGGVLSGVLVALIGYLATRKKTDVDREQRFMDQLQERIDQQSVQLRDCEEGHRQTRVELEELRRQHHHALEQIDVQAGSNRRLEEELASLRRQVGELRQQLGPPR